MKEKKRRESERCGEVRNSYEVKEEEEKMKRRKQEGRGKEEMRGEKRNSYNGKR